VSRLFTYLDEDDEGFLTKEKFIAYIRLYMKVMKETVLTDAVSIKESTVVRRLDKGERCEVIDGPVKEDQVGVVRMKIKMATDGLEGWVTPLGDQGTVFLEDTAMLMKVVKETILTPTFAIDTSAKTKRKLKEGELVEIREMMTKEPESGLMRAKVRTRVDNLVGWATVVGNTGGVFMEEM